MKRWALGSRERREVRPNGIDEEAIRTLVWPRGRDHPGVSRFRPTDGRNPHNPWGHSQRPLTPLRRRRASAAHGCSVTAPAGVRRQRRNDQAAVRCRPRTRSAPAGARRRYSCTMWRSLGYIASSDWRLPWPQRASSAGVVGLAAQDRLGARGHPRHPRRSGGRAVPRAVDALREVLDGVDRLPADADEEVLRPCCGRFRACFAVIGDSTRASRPERDDALEQLCMRHRAARHQRRRPHRFSGRERAAGDARGFAAAAARARALGLERTAGCKLWKERSLSRPVSAAVWQVLHDRPELWAQADKPAEWSTGSS